MTKVRLIVRRRDNGKQVSKMKRVHWGVLADHLNKSGEGGGIVELLVPKLTKEIEELLEAQKKFQVATVKSRNVNNPRNVFSNFSLIYFVIQWLLEVSLNPNGLTIDRISKRLADEHFKIVQSLPNKDQKLEKVFTLYNPLLLTIFRKQSWWKGQIRLARKYHKSREEKS